MTPEQNAILREKKRQSKQRKNAEQEAARANLHTHDTFPAYHPYRNVGLATQSGAYRNGSFASSIVEDINNQRVSSGVVGMPNAPALPQTSSVLQPYQLPQQQQSSGSGTYFYDGRYQAAPSTSTSTAANALFDVGAGLNSAPRRPSVMAPYTRKQSFEATAVTTTTTADGWSRASEPRSSFSSSSSSTSSYRYDTIPTSTAGGLNILTPNPNPLPSISASTSYYTTTFPPETEPQRYMSAFASPHPSSSSAGFEHTSPPIATPTSTQSTGYFEAQTEFRPPSTSNSSSPFDQQHQQQQYSQSLSPHSVTSPSHLSTAPHLERAPSSTDSRSAASPDASPHHNQDSHIPWPGSGESKKQFFQGRQQSWETSAAAAGEEVTNWAQVNHHPNNVGGGKCDSVVSSIYL